MRKPEHRHVADRRGVRYPSALSDAERALAEPPIPPAKHGGRQRSVDMLDRISYGLSTGCQWNALFEDLPPKSTI